MARRGKFGRAPAPAPNLASTIVAIGREMQNRRDQNIVEAWKTGGVFEGKPVTDSQLLSYWNGRLGDVDQTDPMYDTYKTAYMQFDYAIAESRVTTEYSKIVKPSAADDMKVARFYLNWAKKVPKDSEFYRTLQRDAAQFVRASKTRGGGGGGGGGGGSSTAGLKAALDAIEKKNELPGQTAVMFLTLLAQKGGVLGSTPMGGPETILAKTNIDELQVPGVDDVVGLLAQVSVPDGKGGFTGSKEVLYHDASGKPVTGADIVTQMRKIDPTFNGNFNMEYLRHSMDVQRQGITQRITLLTRAGRASDASALQTHLSKLNELGQQVSAFDVVESYALLKEREKSIMQDGTLTPDAKLRGLKEVRSAIGALASDPSIATDDHMRSQLLGEAAGKAGTLTLNEDLQGYKSGFTTEQDAGNSEVLNVNSMMDYFQTTSDLVNDPSGAYVLTQGKIVNGEFVPALGGSAQGAAPRAAVAAMAGPAGEAIEVRVPNGDGKGFSSMMLVPGAVTTVALDANGQKIETTKSNPIVASFVRYPVNGQMVTLYGVKSAQNGALYWTADAPFGDGFKPKTMPNGDLVIDLSAYVQQQIADGNVGAPGQSPSGVVARRLSDGTIVYGYEPAAAALATDPVRQAAGFDKDTDSYSPTLAGLRASGDEARLLIEYKNDPSYGADQERDSMISAGMRYDPATGTVVPPDARQQDILRRNADSRAYSEQIAEYGNRPVGDRWWRDTTETQMAGYSSRPKVINSATGFTVNPSDQLPSDYLRAGTTDFAAFTTLFKSGTNLISTDPLSATPASIRSPEPLKLPTVGTITPLPAESKIYEPKVTPTVIPTATTPKISPVTGFTTGTNPLVEPLVTPLTPKQTTAVTAKPIYSPRAI